MANPQKENGYTPIANELLEAIYKAGFNATQLDMLLVVFRYTYGFSRKDHEFSIRFLSEATGISERNVRNELTNLIKNKIVKVTAENSFTSSRRLAVNKNYEEWITRERIKRSTGDELILRGWIDPQRGDELIRGGGDELIPQDKQSLKQESNICAATPPDENLKRFSKPDPEQIAAYCRERENGIDPHKFYDFYESKGWYVGKNKMKDWKAAVRTWEKNTTKSPGANELLANPSVSKDKTQEELERRRKEMGLEGIDIYGS